MECIIDAKIRNNEPYIKLALWGKLGLFYVIDAVIEAEYHSRISVCTDDEYLVSLVKEKYPKVDIISDITDDKKNTMIISGGAVLLSPETILDVCKKSEVSNSNEYSYIVEEKYIEWGKVEKTPRKINIFEVHTYSDDCVNNYIVPETESVLLNSKNNFELALVLLNKKNKSVWLKEGIKKRIEEKKADLSRYDENSICIVGHSQFDKWNIERISNLAVQNCGISGISSFEYKEMILDKGLFDTRANVIVMIHGTNDIVYDFSMEEIIRSIKGNVDIIKKSNPNSKLFFIECLHVNGRLDRQNDTINTLNMALKESLTDVIWIPMNEMDDAFGNLCQECTVDGLHLSEIGYVKFKAIIEKYVEGAVNE